MSGIRLEIDLNNSTLQQTLHRLQGADRAGLLAAIGEYQLSETLQNFDAERTPEGVAWQQSQRAADSGGKTLQHKGHLRDSYTYQVSGNAVELGSNMIYAAIHHAGGKAGRGRSVTISARTALGVTAQNETEISQIGLDYLQSIIQ